MLKVGLTGGIGCGKSTVSELFKQLGTPVIDADQIAHDLVRPGQPALKKITEKFGSGVLNADSTLNRAKMRTLIFNNPEKKTTLENILHPLIRTAMTRQADTLRSPYCIFSIPLLLEKNMTDIVDRILVVDCPTELQLERACRRDHSSEQAIRQIIDSQVSREARLNQADDIIDNSNNANRLAEQVKKLHNLYLKGLQSAKPSGKGM